MKANGEKLQGFPPPLPISDSIIKSSQSLEIESKQTRSAKIKASAWKIGQMGDIHGAQRESQSKLWMVELITRRGADVNQQRLARRNQKGNKESDEIIALG